MTQTENLFKWLPTEMGGLDAGPIQRVEHEYAPWEKRCHALANVLDIHKIISTEERSAAASRPWGARWSTSSLTTSVGLSPSPTFCFRNKSSLPRNWPERWTRSRRATPSRRRLAEQPPPDRP